MAKTPAKKTKTEVSTESAQMPAFMKGYEGAGTESLEAKDIEIPRVILLHPQSPAVMEEGEQPGTFYHTIAEEALGKEVKVVPLFVRKQFILWRPREDGGGILARADDGVHWSPPNAKFDVVLKGGAKVHWETAETVEASGLAEWGTENPNDPESPPAATEMIVVAVALPDYPELSPSLLTLQRSAVKVGRKLAGKLKMSSIPSFGRVFEMTTRMDEGPQGRFFNYQFRADGLIHDEAQFERYKELYEMFKRLGIQIKDIEGIQNDDVVDTGDDIETDAQKRKY